MVLDRHGRFSLAALLAGAAGIGFAPIFVRLSEVGPVATGFYRLFLAMPVLCLWMGWERKRDLGNSPTRHLSNGLSQGTAEAREPQPKSGRMRPLFLMAVAGAFFAGDLAFWHWSIKLTSVANSTLLTNFAPFFVTLGAWLLFSERITGALVAGLIVAFAGGAMLVGTSVSLTADHVLGDLLALVTAVFYAGYLLTVKHLRGFCSTPGILAGSGVVSGLLLWLIAWISREALWTDTAYGWSVLIGLAMISHIGGQGLITHALAHLPASFSSVSLLFQPVVAAALAWGILGEPLSELQIAGGCVVLAGIAIATWSKRR